MLDGSVGCGIRPDEGREATLEPKGSGGRERMCCGFTADDSGHPSHGPEPSCDGCTPDKTQSGARFVTRLFTPRMPSFALMPDDGLGRDPGHASRDGGTRSFEPFSSGRVPIREA